MARAEAVGTRHEAGVSAGTSFVIDQDRQVVVVRFGKTVSMEDIAQYVTQLRAHPAFHPKFSEIADLTKIEQLDLQADEFFKLADQVDPFALEARRAFVVSTSVQAHAARMHKILRTQRNFEIFHSMQEAERWISA